MVPLFNWNIQTTNNHLVNVEVAEVKSLETTPLWPHKAFGVHILVLQ